MRHPKQSSMSFSGQVMGPPLGAQETFREDAMSMPSYGVSVRDLQAEPSRKRKTLGVDQQGSNTSHSIRQLVLDYSCSGEPNLQHNIAASFGMNVPGNALGMSSKQISETAEQNKEVLQVGCYQYQSLKINMPWSLQKDGRNSSKSMFENTKNSCSNSQSHLLHTEMPLTLMIPPAGKIPALPDPQALVYSIVSPIGACNYSSLVQNNRNIEKTHSDGDLKDSVHFVDRNHVLASNLPLQFQSKPSQGFGSSDLSILKNRGSHVYLDGGKSILEVHECVPSFEVKQSDKSLDIKNAGGASTARMGSSGTSKYTGGTTTGQSCLNSDELISGACEKGVAAQTEGRDQSNSGLDIQNTGKTKEPSIKILNNYLGEEILPKNAENPAQTIVEQRHANDSQHDSCDLDGKNKARAGNVAPIIAEKLWDGSLQLNASVTVSAVAFFKSGEKAPGIHWSQSIEVKGKVRLEAFEKFIQELPRSRSRGLMVTSLCWKVGSSEAGLAGMKEVAKGYKDGERVGFAQLSLGIDLYVCPRSDTIITILAKYGFFKGMAAIEDDQDSLIGCVVWRRHRSSLDSIPKKYERKNLPLSEKSPNSHMDTSTQLNADVNKQITKASNSSIPLGSENGYTTTESAGSKAFAGNNIQSNKADIGVGESETADNTKLISSVADCSPISPCRLKSDTDSNSNNLKGCTRFEVNAVALDSSGKEKPATSQELMRPLLLPQLQNAVTQNEPAPDDDDLPEFDFSTACGVYRSPVRKSILIPYGPLRKPMCINNAHVLDSASLEEKLLANEAKNSDGPKHSLPYIVQQTTITSHNKSGIPSFPVLLDTSQGMPSQNKLGEDEYPRMVLPFSGANPMVSCSDLSSQPSTCKPACNSVLPPSKELWDDDDDDMPEWCPPDLEQQHQPTALSTLRNSNPIAPSLVSKLTSEKRPQAPPLPLPSPALQTKGLPHKYQHCPVTMIARPAQSQTNPAGGHVQYGPRSSLELNSSSSFTPRPNFFDPRLHMPAGWRGWRP